MVPVVQGVNIYPRLKDGLRMNWSSMKLTSLCQNGYAGISNKSMLCCKYIFQILSFRLVKLLVFHNYSILG